MGPDWRGSRGWLRRQPHLIGSARPRYAAKLIAAPSVYQVTPFSQYSVLREYLA